MTLARDAKEIVDAATAMLNGAIASGKLEEVVAAIENADGKPVDAKIITTNRASKHRLQKF